MPSSKKLRMTEPSHKLVVVVLAGAGYLIGQGIFDARLSRAAWAFSWRSQLLAVLELGRDQRDVVAAAADATAAAAASGS